MNFSALSSARLHLTTALMLTCQHFAGNGIVNYLLDFIARDPLRPRP